MERDEAYNAPLGDQRLIACPDCDLRQRLPELAPGGAAADAGDRLFEATQ